MARIKLVLIFTLLLLLFYGVKSQENMFGNSRISGNFQLDIQSYKSDTLIGAPEVDEQILSNGFLWLNYSSNNFRASMRYENYMNPILGFDKRYKGSGIAHRSAEFTSGIVDIAAGNFYEQFGSGMIFRAYQEYALGIDNAMDGLRVKFRPLEGIEIIGVIGRQRNFWSLGEGIVRGGDIDISLNDVAESIVPEDLQVSLGGSIISKYQADHSSQYNLPENVLMWASRLSMAGSEFNFEAEYGYKNPDPSGANMSNFNSGNALLLSASYYPEGIGISLNFHRNDNMDVRSDRAESGNSLLINFLPPLTKQYTYALANMYPYATQLNGEIGIQAEVTYTIPRKTLLGGQYGTTINLNFSQVNSIVKNPVDVDQNSGQIFTYDSPIFEIGDRLFFRDMSIEITRKWSKKLKSVFTYLNLVYNKDVMEAEGAAVFGKLKADIIIADLTYKFSSKYALRVELQHMWAEQDSVLHVPDNQNGNWAMFLTEFTMSPHWYISLSDQWNYGNELPEPIENELQEGKIEIGDRKIHYIIAAMTYVYEATRFSFGYGRQRSGIICVGGVCRNVPASNGFLLSISSSF